MADEVKKCPVLKCRACKDAEKYADMCWKCRFRQRMAELDRERIGGHHAEVEDVQTR